MGDAAGSPIGANPITATTKLRDALIIVVIPFLVPAAVLPVANGPDSLTLTNLAFGFVAVAIAGTARAAASKTDAWLTYALGAMTCVVFQTALAISGDTAKETETLSDIVVRETERERPNLSAVRDAALAAIDAEPGAFSWVCSGLIGAMLMALSVLLIVRER